MKVVIQNTEGTYFEFGDQHHISLTPGMYKIAYGKLTDSEWENGDRLDQVPIFTGEFETDGEFAILKTGVEVYFCWSGYNDYDQCDPYILKSVVTIT
jgi:hypothetical protein